MLIRCVMFHSIGTVEEPVQMCSIDRRDFSYFALKTFRLEFTKGFKRVRCPNPITA